MSNGNFPLQPVIMQPPQLSEPMPPDYLPLSIFTLLCCFWPLSVFALIKSLEVLHFPCVFVCQRCGTSLAYVVDGHVDLLCSLVTDLDSKKKV